jgi:hypothetical protein
MKKLYTLLISCIFSITATAQNFYGGEITAQHVSGNDYIVSVIDYPADTALLNPTRSIEILDSANQVLSTQWLPVDLTNSYQIISINYPDTIRKVVFKGILTFPYVGKFTLISKVGFRDTTILNLYTPDAYHYENVNIVVHTSINTNNNSSPAFLSLPFFYFQKNQNTTCNVSAYDINSDSLSYILTTPYGGTYTNITTVSGYYFPNNLILDAITGDISWTPDSVGIYAIDVLVKEFRNGIQIGEVLREIDLIVADTTLQNARLTNWNNITQTNGQGYHYINAIAGQLNNFQLNVLDSNTTAIVSISSFGEPYMLPGDSATFNIISKTSSNTAVGEFSWTPNVSTERNRPYMLTFRVGNGTFSNDYTMLVYVVDMATGIDDNSSSIINIYPNPATDKLYVDLSNSIEVNILNELGEIVKTASIKNNEEYIDISDFASGLYFVRGKTDSGTSIKKFIKE